MTCGRASSAWQTADSRDCIHFLNALTVRRYSRREKTLHAW